MRYLGVSIGCLECRRETLFYGPFETEDEARAALDSPETKRLADMKYEDAYGGDWYGESVQVIVDLLNIPGTRKETQ